MPVRRRPVMKPPSQWESIPARYGGALGCVAASLAVRAFLTPVLNHRNPYIVAALFVMVSARYFGIGPSIFATIAGAISATWIFGTGDAHGEQVPIVLSFYFVISLAAIWLMETQRRDNRIAQASARLSARLRAVVESSGDAIVSIGLEGAIESWNAAAARLLGRSASEMMGKTMDALIPADLILREAELIARIRIGTDVEHFETVRLRRDGAPVHVSLTISPVRDSDGVITGASHIYRDITQQKMLEEQLREAQKVESLGVLAGGLAHDFNNLLTGIMGSASLGIEDCGDPQATRAHLTTILDASDRAALLVRQLLAYAGKGRYVVEQADLSRLINDLAVLLRDAIPRAIDLRLALDPACPRIEADRSQLQQLVMNLVLNAAEAIGEQPGEIVVGTAARGLGIDARVVLSVRDDGCGMDEATQARMFDPFFTTKFTGRGLGLSAVMGIVRAHRGSIAVESRPGAGAIVEVLFPPSLPVEESDLRGSGRILVVDDEAPVRSLAKTVLERFGYTVEVAAEGAAAVAIFAARPEEFSAVLLDWIMPFMGGEDVLGRLRALRPEIPVVLSSGFNEEDALERFAGHGLSGFLRKPYTAGDLARKIHRAVGATRP